jgi:hypothetical protein
LVSLALLLGAVQARGDTVRLEADRDATLIENAEGAWANGAGPALFAGRTSQAQGSIRRALVYFDVAGALPEGAIVESVVLTLFVTPSHDAPRLLRIHRAQADWGEGPSASAGGAGAAAQPGDVTWIHGFYDDEEWVHAGGQFLGRESAEASVAASGFYQWWGTDEMRADVELWAAAPERNFGWVLLGDETTSQSVKSLASREHPDAALRPALEITYRMPGQAPRH